MRTLLFLVFGVILASQASLSQVNPSNYKNDDYWVQPVVELNSSHLDFSPVYFDQGIVFVSNREIGPGLGKRPDFLTGEICTALLFSAFQADGSLGNPVLFSKSLSSDFHDGPACFSKDGRRIFFNRNIPIQKSNATQKQLVKSSKELNLKIYSAEKLGGDWTAAQPVELYGGNYSDMHPSLSADGQQLLFASDRPGGFGGMDLYLSTFYDGKWSFPVNLGPGINTPGNEVFPYIYDEQTLYFASDARGGFGGLDIYKCLHDADFSSASMANLGSPINSEQDDFGWVTNQTGEAGFFTSNRKGGQGSDDLYRFVKMEKMENGRHQMAESKGLAALPVNGKVFRQGTDLPLAGAEMTLVNLCSGKLFNLKTDAKGFFDFKADCQCDYLIRATVNGFYQIDKMFTTTGFDCQHAKADDVLYLDLPMVTNMEAEADSVRNDNSYKAMLESGFLIELGGIYYDFDQFKLQPLALAELDKVADLMLRQPSLQVEVRSHTDSRGDDDYNLYLSSNRANSVAAYLTLKGIEANRVAAKGFGEEQLVNGCVDGATCTEEEHQMNRRTELKLYKK